jgi:hypothetical protein
MTCTNCPLYTFSKRYGVAEKPLSDPVVKTTHDICTECIDYRTQGLERVKPNVVS